MGIQIDARKELKRVLEKVTSVRSIVSVMIIWTVCYVTMNCMDLLKVSVQNKDQFLLVKEVFIYLMGIVSGIAGSIITLYFTRSDRHNGNGEVDNEVDKSKQPK